MATKHKRLARFGRDIGGASAVEFALIAPVLAALLLGLAEVGYIMYQRTDMHTAVRSGGQYVLNGGRDLDVARELVERSWTSMPGDGMVVATRYCLCAGSAHACNSPCNDDSVPEAYVALQASATLGGIIIDEGQTVDDAIRIR